MNGCPNSCARFQVADIGLMSALQPRPDGTRSDAFLVHLGGTMGEDAAFGRKVKGVKIYAEDAADYVEAAARRYPQQKRRRRHLLRVREARWTTPGWRGSPPRRPCGHGAAMSDVARRAVLLPVLRRAEILRRPTRSGWRCESCERVFELSLLGSEVRLRPT